MIKGLRGIHHVAISVPDLTAAEDFYCGVLGFSVADRYDFEASAIGDAILGLKDGAANSILVNAGNIYLEIFEFLSPEPEPQVGLRPVCDHGYTHLAFDVDDIETAYVQLAEAGVQWHCPPSYDADPEGNVVNTYGRDPFGNVIEIQQLTPQCAFHSDKLNGWKGPN